VFGAAFCAVLYQRLILCGPARHTFTFFVQGKQGHFLPFQTPRLFGTFYLSVLLVLHERVDGARLARSDRNFRVWADVLCLVASLLCFTLFIAVFIVVIVLVA
jgi:hypothetical protein